MENWRIINLKDDEITEKAIIDCANLYCQIWQEPPWNEFFWKPEKVAATIYEVLQRTGSAALLAVSADNREILGFTWGFPVDREALRRISGGKSLDSLMPEKKKLFYIAELGVAKKNRKTKIGSELTKELLQVARRKFPATILRTDLDAKPARSLYRRLGFREMPIRDSDFSNRTYWIKRS